MSVALSARTDISVGTLINLELPSVRPGEDTIEQKFQGGNHLITQIKWTLNRNELRTNLKVVKDSLMNNIETTAMDYGETVKI
jgi:hypothetical protein